MRRDGEQRQVGIGAIADPGIADRADESSAIPGNTHNRLGELRSLVDVLARAIADHSDPSLESQEAGWRADELAEALRDSSPSAPRVKSRWIRLAPLVRELNMEPLGATIDELIAKVF